MKTNLLRTRGHRALVGGRRLLGADGRPAGRALWLGLAAVAALGIASGARLEGGPGSTSGLGSTPGLGSATSASSPSASSSSASTLDSRTGAPEELVAVAARGRPPGFGAAVSLVALGEMDTALLVGAPAGLAVGGGGLVLGARQESPGQDWWVGGPRSWWRGPLRVLGVSPPTALTAGRGDDEQGRVISSSTGWAALGAPGATQGEVRTGAVSLVDFRAPLPHGEANQILWAPPGSVAGDFGAALAFFEAGGETRALAVGAPHEGDPVTGVPLAGAVHVYEPIPNAGGCGSLCWALVRTIRPRSPAIGLSFGSAVAFVGGVLVIGAPGDGRQAPGAGSLVGVDQAGERLWRLESAEAGARLGSRLCALGADWGMGSPGFAVSAPGRGRVHIHGLTAAVPQAMLELRGRAGGGFGLSLASMDQHLLVGAPFAGFQGVPLAGLVRRYVAGQGETPVETIRPPSPTIGGEFGAALAVRRGRDGVVRLAVGEPGSDQGGPPAVRPCRPGQVTVFALP